METIIKIIEENNQLKIDGEYEPIVCGNSIYSLSFSFGEKWNACKNKTAVFLVDDKYVLIQFSGNVVNIPTLPNASCLSVSLLSGNGDDQLATTAVKIKLKTTQSINEFVNLDLFENYLQKIHSAVNKIENGELAVERAEIANNVLNTNLLINGNFKINQRGSSEYSGTNIYTVDRWRLSGTGSVSVVSDGVKYTANGSWTGIRQYIENPSFLSNKTITISFNVTGSVGIWANVLHNGNTVASTYNTKTENQTLTLTHTFGDVLDSDSVFIRFTTREAGDWFVLNWVKMEFGETSTPFVPRLYSEELNLCQRYYQKYETYSILKCAKSSYLMYEPCFKFIKTMRVAPTRTIYSNSGTVGKLTNLTTSTEVEAQTSYVTRNSCSIQFSSGTGTAEHQYSGSIELDAEIY